jgi:hypothetical protein
MGDFGNKLAWNFLKGLNLWSILLFVYKSAGKESVVRFLTPPTSMVKSITTSTGANFEQAVEERGEAVEEMLEFLEALVDKDFEDPDTNEVL